MPFILILSPNTKDSMILLKIIGTSFYIQITSIFIFLPALFKGLPLSHKGTNFKTETEV